MLNTVERYVMREVITVFGALLVTLLLVMLSLLLLRTLEAVNLGALTTTVALRFLGYQLLRDMAPLLPPTWFLATLIALGRMARDSELVALHACGIGTSGIYRALVYLALPLALLTAWLALIAQPYAAAQIQTLRDAQREQVAQLAGLRAGRYYQYAQGQLTFYAAAITPDQQFRGIVLQDRRHSPPRLVMADLGSYRESAATGERFIVLQHGRRYDGQPGTGGYHIAEFTRYQLRLPDAGTSQLTATRKQASKSTRELFTAAAHTPAPLQRANRTELDHRLANPIAIIALLLIAVPLITLSPRHSGSGRWLLAFLAYFAFFNLQRIAEYWLEQGVTPLWLGSLWYQGVIVISVLGILTPRSFLFKRVYALTIPRGNSRRLLT